MSLGIEGDPSKFNAVRASDVAMVHTAHDGTIVGGFTLRAPATDTRSSRA